LKICKKILLILFCLFVQNNSVLSKTLLSDPVFRSIADRMNIAYLGQENVIDKVMEVYRLDKNEFNRAVLSGILHGSIERHRSCGLGKIDQWTDKVLSDLDGQMRLLAHGVNGANKKKSESFLKKHQLLLLLLLGAAVLGLVVYFSFSRDESERRKKKRSKKMKEETIRVRLAETERDKIALRSALEEERRRGEAGVGPVRLTSPVLQDDRLALASRESSERTHKLLGAVLDETRGMRIDMANVGRRKVKVKVQRRSRGERFVDDALSSVTGVLVSKGTNLVLDKIGGAWNRNRDRGGGGGGSGPLRIPLDDIIKEYRDRR